MTALLQKAGVHPFRTPYPLLHQLAGKCADNEQILCRRGDVRDGERFLPNEHFIEIMEGLREGLKYHGLTAKFTTFQRATRVTLRTLSSTGTASQGCTSTSPWWKPGRAWRLLMCLSQAHSSFSYSAGLYNEGLTVYSKFWHLPLPSWITFHDRTQLVRAVAQQHVGVLLWKRLALRQPAPESI